MNVHQLKTVQPHFDDVLNNKKRAEIRAMDRDFKVGDLLELCEFTGEKLTGKRIHRIITHVLVDPGLLQDGFGMLSVRPLTKEEKSELLARGTK